LTVLLAAGFLAAGFLDPFGVVLRGDLRTSAIWAALEPETVSESVVVRIAASASSRKEDAGKKTSTGR